MKKISTLYLNYSIKFNCILEQDFTRFLIFLFLFSYIFSSGDVEAQGFNGKKYGIICKRVLETLEGKFGSMLTAAAGLGAIVSSAAGGFKMAWSLIVVAVGSFTLRTYQEIWFAPCSG